LDWLNDNLFGLLLSKVLTFSIFSTFLKVSVVSGLNLIFSSSGNKGRNKLPFVSVFISEVNEELVFRFGPDVSFDVGEEVVDISISDLFTITIFHMRSNDGPFRSELFDEFSDLGIFLCGP